ncbi:hypothetical protein GGR77_002935 [Xanthomonas translucens]
MLQLSLAHLPAALTILFGRRHDISSLPHSPFGSFGTNATHTSTPHAATDASSSARTRSHMRNAFKIFARANRLSWTPSTSFNSGACGVRGGQRPGPRDVAVTATFSAECGRRDLSVALRPVPTAARSSLVGGALRRQGNAALQAISRAVPPPMRMARHLRTSLPARLVWRRQKQRQLLRTRYHLALPTRGGCGDHFRMARGDAAAVRCPDLPSLARRRPETRRRVRLA